VTGTLRTFELFVASRYLVAKRRQAVVSLITVIAIGGVAAGVAALVIAMAINSGFRQTLERLLLGATAHISILEKQPGGGIADWRELAVRLRQEPGVTEVTPVLYGAVFFSSPIDSAGGVLKGIPGQAPDGGIALGSKLAARIGMRAGSRVTIISPQGELTPFGPRPSYFPLRVRETFTTGFYDLDSAWAIVSLENAQRILSTGDTVNSIELRLANAQDAVRIAARIEPKLSPGLAATPWTEQYRPLLSALRTEKIVSVLTISLIELVAALNILITLTMMVMEKNREIAILVAMGARAAQIRLIFILEGGLIGVCGAAIGLLLGHTVCWAAERGRWLKLDEQVYALGYLPFDPRWADSAWIAAAAIAISLLATLHPAREAARVLPAEALRYE
jgi:lipoprotein-releasing system permease protein